MRKQRGRIGLMAAALAVCLLLVPSTALAGRYRHSDPGYTAHGGFLEYRGRHHYRGHGHYRHGHYYGYRHHHSSDGSEIVAWTIVGLAGLAVVDHIIRGDESVIAPRDPYEIGVSEGYSEGRRQGRQERYERGYEVGREAGRDAGNRGE